jgi:hypothetical protein
MTKTFVVSGSDCRLLKRRQYFIALRPVVWLVSTKQEFFACFWMCLILLLFVFYRIQVSMFFRQWSNIFLADQDERQRCFFADQKQFPADHWSLIGRYFEPCRIYENERLHCSFFYDYIVKVSLKVCKVWTTFKTPSILSGERFL